MCAAACELYDGVLGSHVWGLRHVVNALTSPATVSWAAAALGLPIVTDARLREHNLGVFQGMTMADARQRYPEEVRRYFNDASYPIPDGERCVVWLWMCCGCRRSSLTCADLWLWTAGRRHAVPAA